MYAKIGGSRAMFAACDNTSTIHDTKWVTLEPTQTSNMTWTHHEPSSNIKAGWASQACCECGNGLKRHFHRLRDTFACHYTEIAARPNQKWLKKLFFLAPYMKWSQPPATSSSGGSSSKAHSSPAQGLKAVTCYCLPFLYFQWGSETKIHTGSDERALRRKQRPHTTHFWICFLFSDSTHQACGGRQAASSARCDHSCICDLNTEPHTHHSRCQVSGQKLCS